jgi:aryl-alcohol dehydrogenase-like predicted oxidoreductase
MADFQMLHQNIKALEIKLTPEEMKEIEGLCDRTWCPLGRALIVQT